MEIRQLTSKAKTLTDTRVCFHKRGFYFDIIAYSITCFDDAYILGISQEATIKRYKTAKKGAGRV